MTHTAIMADIDSLPYYDTIIDKEDGELQIAVDARLLTAWTKISNPQVCASAWSRRLPKSWHN